MKSMTGFGRGEARRDDVSWTAECASVNRKQLEAAVSLPRELSELEAQVRNLVAASVSRGRVNVTVRSESASEGSANAVNVDHALAQQYYHALHALALKLEIPAEVSLHDLMRLPGVVGLQQAETSAEQAWPLIDEAVSAALKQMNAMRETEGAHLREEMESRLSRIEGLLASIREKAVTVPETQRKLLRQRLEDAGLPLPLDDERLVKEIALFADRTDISEELSRAASHVKQFRTYLASSEPVGRSLDFLLQEFFREFNTMGSKCNQAEIAHHVVTAKTELEKIREQVQNVE
ncbi:MAG: YicC/YloC family endoribonuclease [Prosthecobacter sp.]